MVRVAAIVPEPIAGSIPVRDLLRICYSERMTANQKLSCTGIQDGWSGGMLLENTHRFESGNFGRMCLRQSCETLEVVFADRLCRGDAHVPALARRTQPSTFHEVFFKQPLRLLRAFVR